MTEPGELLIHKLAARVALVQLQPAEAAVLAECFRQFKIETVEVHDRPEVQLVREKFEGAVLRLKDDSEPLLKAIRTAPSNRALVLYALADNKTAVRFSPYGINAIFPEPVEKYSALKLVRGTYLLALHEFRRYVRVPVAIGVDIENGAQHLNALSLEVSSGGMSLKADDAPADSAKPLTAGFQLPGSKYIVMKAGVCWRRPKEGSFGIRFVASEPNRLVVRDWIEDFLALH
jgi:hypothetical protein